MNERHPTQNQHNQNLGTPSNVGEFVIEGLSHAVHHFRMKRLESAQRKLAATETTRRVMENTAEHFLIPGRNNMSEERVREIEVGYYGTTEASSNLTSLRPLSRVERRQAYRNGRRMRRNLERGALSTRSRAVYGTIMPTQGDRLTKKERKLASKAIKKQSTRQRKTNETLGKINSEINSDTRHQRRLDRRILKLRRKISRIETRIS